MASVASTSSSTWQTVTSGNSLTITKPTGLTSGDVMVAHLSNVVGGSNNADGWDTPSGWTALTSTNQNANSNSSARLDTFYKVADSSDVAASDFSFVKNGSQGTTVQGNLYRITGVNAVGTFIAASAAVATDDTTPTFANTITPPFANSVLLFLTTVADAAQTTGSVASYAVTTSSPSWTEAYDSVGDIAGHRGLASGAYATRPELTATGDSSCTYTNFQQNSIGVIVRINTAPIIQSVSTGTWIGRDNGESITITKPTNTTDGDLLVAHLAGADNSSGGNTITAPVGWTTLGSTSAGASGSADLWVFYKTASSEGASYNFTNSSGAGLMMQGSIYRISNWGGTLNIALDGDDTADSTPTFTNTITPLSAYNLLLFLLSANDNAASGSVASYAITTSNPSWTESYDSYGTGDTYFGAGDGDGLMSGAYAIRPEVTATGNSTCTLTTFANRSVGAIITIQPETSVDIHPTVLSSTCSVQAPTVTGSAVVPTLTVLTTTVSTQAPTITTAVPDWSNVDKSSAPSWVNTDKS
jgi:hypothetical protein